MLLAACEGRSSSAPPPPPPPPPLAPTDAAREAGAGDLLAYPASRCAECHGKMHDEWTGSAHARAATSPLYVRMRERAGEPACDGCHAPLAAHLPAGDLAIAEGVTCEVCHNIRAVTPRRTGPGFELRLDRIKLGPLCDAKDHYFHRMGCSPLHAQATLCAGCHVYYRGSVPILTEYEEWRDGPYQARECQSCHMPGSRAEVAEGAGARDGVGHHGWLGAAGDLRRRAVAARARVSEAAGVLTASVRVENTGAGHAVPSGLPERRLIVRATAFGPDGAPRGRAERAFGRVLVDAAGTRVPFYAATRVLADDRIPPKQAREVELELPAPPSGELRLEVVWRPVDAEIGASLEIRAADEVPLLRASLPLRPPRAGARPALPRTIELER